jgi:hypothetical protein
MVLGTWFETAFALTIGFKELFMWKILVGFILFAGLGLFMIFKGGDKIDMSGEKSETGSHTAAPAEAPASAPALPGSAAK